MTRPLPDDKRTKPYVLRNSPWVPSEREAQLLKESELPTDVLAKRFGVTARAVRYRRRKLLQGEKT